MTSSSHSLHRRRRRVLIAAALLLAAVVFFFVWFNRPIEPQAAILTTDTPIPAAQSYAASPEESLLMIIIDSRFGKLEGHYQMGAGTVEFQREGDGWRLIANLTFDGRTLDIGNAALNTAMRSALEVEKYPSGIFVAQSSDLFPDLTTARQVDLVGKLELHGSVQDYTVPTQVTFKGDQITLSAETIIDSGKFGISIPALIAKDKLPARMNIVAYRTTPASP